MPIIHISLDRLDAQVLLPMILEQSRDRVRTAAGGYWLVLHTAITAALGSQRATDGAPPPDGPERSEGTPSRRRRA
jgi:hypothetical protein